MHLCESWGALNVDETHFLHVQVLRFLKLLLGCDFWVVGGGYKSDVSVIGETIGVSPRLLIACRRLVFLAKLLHTGHDRLIILCLAAALKYKGAWINAVLDDARLIGQLSGFDWFSGMTSVKILLRGLRAKSLASLKRQLKQVLKHPFAKEVATWGFIPKNNLIVSEISVTCRECGRSFADKRRLSNHMFLEHGRVDPVRERVDTVVCPSCMCDFESRERIIRHCQGNGSKICRKFVLEHTR